MSDAPEILLAHHLKALKLPTFLREHQKLARQCAAEGLDHVRYLARLVELELIERDGAVGVGAERHLSDALGTDVDDVDRAVVGGEDLFEHLQNCRVRSAVQGACQGVDAC